MRFTDRSPHALKGVPASGSSTLCPSAPVTTIPKTNYAKSGGVNVAYQVFGEGPIDLVFIHGFISNIELVWESPIQRRFFERLASFARVISFDKRGQGISDPVAGAPILEERMDDVIAVMDAAGSERAAFFTVSEGGPLAMLFSATYPERVSALVLYGTLVKGTFSEDYPYAPTPEMWDMYFELVRESWGEGETLNLIAPSVALDDDFRANWGRVERMSSSPGMVEQILRMCAKIDARHVLPTITAPTLILHRTGDQNIPVEVARYMSQQIPGAKLVELPGDDHLFFVGDIDPVIEETEEFLTGARSSAVPDRVLATVMFTDIVDSTRRASELGDRGWRDLVERHDQLMRRELERHRGREVKTMGDGFLAMFDGPARAIRCACAARDALRPLGVEIRAGLHTGELEIVPDGDVRGIAVNIGARVGSAALGGEVLVSRTVTDLVAGSGIEFADRGVHSLKGVPGEWQLFSVR
jgi:class 3 adenylate cyclase/pimeloyl-ACP methyl ester carboxylesterase